MFGADPRSWDWNWARTRLLTKPFAPRAAGPLSIRTVMEGSTDRERRFTEQRYVAGRIPLHGLGAETSSNAAGLAVAEGQGHRCHLS